MFEVYSKRWDVHLSRWMREFIGVESASGLGNSLFEPRKSGLVLLWYFFLLVFLSFLIRSVFDFN